MQDFSTTTISHRIYAYTAIKVSSMQQQYLSNATGARAKLAQFRQSLSRTAGESLDVFGEVLEGLPDELQGSGDELSAPEKAIYTALLLYSVHQQSKSEPMHVPKDSNHLGTGFGSAIKRLAYLKRSADSSDTKSPIRRRFDAIATSRDFDEIKYHLRGIVRQLREQNIPLDYAALATDLFLLQSPSYANGVRTRWFREFYRTSYSEEKTNS